MPKHGFIDLQLNGWRGIGFTDPGLTLAEVRKVTLDLLAQGTLAYCPTVVTGPESVYQENLAVLAEALADPEIGPHLLGIHLEAPFLSTQPGAYGAHMPEYILPPSIKTFERYQKWAKGHIKLLTLAPERPGAIELIRELTAQGVVVSIGHHLADKATVEQAVAAGARFCTHIGNGLPNEIHRHKNPIWVTLAEDRLWGGFITDGHHLPAELIKVALRAKTPARFVVTSDVAPLGGLPPGTYQAMGKTVVIEPSGRISCAETQGLFGSHASMLGCMNFLASLQLLSEEELWQVGYTNPLLVLGKEPAALDDLPGPVMEFRDGSFCIQRE